MPVKKFFSTIYSSTAVKIGSIIGLVGFFAVSWTISSDGYSFLDVALNAGTELLGIAITVVFVQSIFESIKKNRHEKSYLGYLN